MSNEKFLVFYTLDYGYGLNPVDDLGTTVIPEFYGNGVEADFNQFFSSSDFGQYVGKKIYCDCVGESYRRDGVIFFKIHKAHIFAE